MEILTMQDLLKKWEEYNEYLDNSNESDFVKEKLKDFAHFMEWIEKGYISTDY